MFWSFEITCLDFFLKDDDSLITKEYMEARGHLCQTGSGAGLCFILSYFFF